MTFHHLSGSHWKAVQCPWRWRLIDKRLERNGVYASTIVLSLVHASLRIRST